MKKILLVSQYFYPEQFRINDICSEWVKKGYDVEVVSGTPNYPFGRFYEGYGFLKKRKEVYNGIKILHIPQVPRKSGSFMLAVNYLSFVMSGFVWSKISNRNPDIVINYSTSPIFQALPGLWFAKRKGIPFYIYVLDLWPDSFKSVTKIESKFIDKVLQSICDYIYRNCEKIFVASKGFVNPIASRGISLEKIVFWPQYAEDFYRPLDKGFVKIPEIPNDEKFNAVFAGNFGYAQGLEVLPDVAKLIKNNDDNIRICMVGDGRFKPTLINLVKEQDVEDVFCFIEKQPASRVPDIMAYCDAAIITLQDDPLFAKTIPAKLQSSLACGIPIALSVAGEAADIVKDANCGYSCSPGNAAELYEVLVKLSKLSNKELDEMRKNARKYFEDNYEAQLLLSKMDKYLFD